ncbi:MAG: YhjD/YihY/BrkB family envelope integrity protein [Gammaproteobacteria bacterium]
MSDTLRARIEAFLWEPRAGESGRLPRLLRTPARFVYALARDLAEGQLTLRAMSLVYTTLLALVPLLAFSLSVLKGFGVHRQVEPLLYEFLQPLGQQGIEITDQIMDFVENIRGGVLGGIGLALLIYAVISMIQKIEDTFNYIWQVQKSRSLARRFSDYLSVVLVGPLLMVTAMGLLATINSSAIMQALSDIRPFGQILALFGEFLPLILVVLVFAFVYAFVPNTRVQLRAALGGAALAGAAWTFGGSLFTNVIVGSTRFDAIYSSFAIAIFALIWLYLSWLVLLIGAQLAFYLQHPQRLRLGRSQQKITIAETERLALGLMQEVGRGFRGGARPDFAELAETLDYSARSLEEITTRLEAADLLTHTEDGAFVPGRDPDTIRLVDILAAVRGEDATTGDHTVNDLIGEVRAAESDRLDGRTLADLVDAKRS